MIGMGKGAVLSSSASRARRYRRRRRAGVAVVPVEVNDEALIALDDYGFLETVEAADMSDRGQIAEAIQLLLFALGERAIEVDYDHFG